MFNRILIVCVGNICRSPMAECLFNARLAGQGFTVASAGLHALAGKPMEPTAQSVLAEHGYHCNHHIARQLETSHLQQADIVLVMEKAHIDAVQAMVPAIRGKVFLLGKWQDNREIPDPYKQPRSLFEHTRQLIDEAVKAWAVRLEQSPTAGKQP